MKNEIEETKFWLKGQCFRLVFLICLIVISVTNISAYQGHRDFIRFKQADAGMTP
jgi:hypothetical protein